MFLFAPQTICFCQLNTFFSLVLFWFSHLFLLFCVSVGLSLNLSSPSSSVPFVLCVLILLHSSALPLTLITPTQLSLATSPSSLLYQGKVCGGGSEAGVQTLLWTPPRWHEAPAGQARPWLKRQKEEIIDTHVSVILSFSFLLHFNCSSFGQFHLPSFAFLYSLYFKPDPCHF